ncbi:hypothetical protein CRD59_01030 [Bifidobacterium xylocopae]|uniref:Uncharacterized protein n=1 Tax=Bifidobacterium xylocopae TaxID=2493119 RepID=A0A366KEF7_9BIFI|nr:hypothetical protein CRD59_01030 [Bifidobacterium xylocopae]
MAETLISILIILICVSIRICTKTRYVDIALTVLALLIAVVDTWLAFKGSKEYSSNKVLAVAGYYLSIAALCLTFFR